MKTLRRIALWAVIPAVLVATLGEASAHVFGGLDLARGGVASLKSGSFMVNVRSAILEAVPCATFTESNVLTSSYLSTVDVLVLVSATGNTTAITPLSAAEQSAVDDFVRSGRGALISADNNAYAGAFSDPANESVLDPFGLDVTGNLSGNQAATATTSHVVLNGPYGTVSVLSAIFSGWFDNLGPYAQAIAKLNANAGACIAVIEPSAIAPGSGAVVLTSDTNFFAGATFPVEAKKLVKNSLLFIGGTDTTAPTVTAPADLVLSADSGSCARLAVTVALGSATAADDCGVVTLTNDAPSSYPVGVTTVTWTATDAAGHAGTAIQTVTIQDHENPTIVAPFAITVSTDVGLCTASSPALGTATANDNCSGVTIANDAPAAFALGTTTVTWTATDAAGNTATATQAVLVEDHENPTIAVSAADFQCASDVPSTSQAPATAADNCGVPAVSVVEATNGGAGTPVSPLVITRTWTATDAAGNAAQTTQTITVVDNTPPTVAAPADMTLPASAGVCTRPAASVTLGVATGTDNCSSATFTNDAPGNYSLGTTTVTWTATDAAGNTAQATQDVTVVDLEPPTLAAPPAVTVTTGPDATTCSALVVEALLGVATATDNCPPATVTRSGVPAGNDFPVGQTTLGYEARDASGNTTTASQVVTVLDGTQPSILAPPDVTIVAAAIPLPAVDVNLGTPVTSDNCAVVTVTNDAPTSYPLGTTLVTWTARDAAGNEGTATQSVAVTTATNLNATILVRSLLHSVESGCRPRVTKVPLALELRVFVRASGPPPSPRDYATIWNSGPGLVPPNVQISGPVAVPQGRERANLYTIQVAASSRYLVIGKANVTCNGLPASVYVGSHTGVLAANSVTRKHLHVLQRANGRCLPAEGTEIPGSLLIVTEPQYLEFESAVELCPIVYESIEGDWNVSVEATPPEGFLCDPPGSLETSLVDSTLQALQFTITDVGSDWTFTRLQHRIRHRGRDIHHRGEPKMIDRRGRRPGGGRRAAGDASDETVDAVPVVYSLAQNFPDPFNPTTTFQFDLPEPATVTLEVFDVAGRRMAVVIDRRQYEPGRHREVFDARELESGLYFYRIRAGAFSSSKKMLLLK